MILCKPILESETIYVDPFWVVAVLETADHDGDLTCKIFLPNGGAMEVFDDGRETSSAIRAWKQNNAAFLKGDK